MVHALEESSALLYMPLEKNNARFYPSVRKSAPEADGQ